MCAWEMTSFVPCTIGSMRDLNGVWTMVFETLAFGCPRTVATNSVVALMNHTNALRVQASLQF